MHGLDRTVGITTVRRRLRVHRTLAVLWLACAPVYAAAAEDILSTSGETSWETPGETAATVEPPVCPAGCVTGNEHEQDTTAPAQGVISERIEREASEAFNPYYVTTHKRNYFIPISYTSNINDERYAAIAPALADEIKDYEAQFQLSIKVRLNRDDLLFSNDGLYFGFTIESWWQLYSKGISSPFRETNYQPEIFYLNPLERHVFGGQVATIFGFEHQSNGQVQGFSRSWNRLYAGAVYGRGRFVAGGRLWYRAFASYFVGYGDSLIDYDHFQQRIGLGLMLSNLF